MVVALIFIACVAYAYGLYVVLKFIATQIKMNDAEADAFKALLDWNADLERKISENEKRILKAEVTASNASNKATVNAKKIERIQGYGTES